MSETVHVDLFAEDRAHEEFLRPFILRVGRESAVDVDVRVRAARGGHGRALDELRNYQRSVARGVAGLRRPDVLVVAIDGNCQPYGRARREIEAAIGSDWHPIAAVACPDPHIERWYMADPASFADVVGRGPRLGKRKCDRGRYKRILADTARRAGHPALLGGIEFAQDLVRQMDLYRAGKNERSLRHFLDDLSARLKRASL